MTDRLNIPRELLSFDGSEGVASVVSVLIDHGWNDGQICDLLDIEYDTVLMIKRELSRSLVVRPND